MQENAPIIYTIGHSTHRIEFFLEMLSHFNVNCLVDVRSLPASRFNPQYNKSALTASLKAKGITYLHFGDEFGARQTDVRVLDGSGRVDFEKMRSSGVFRAGVEKLSTLANKGTMIALMCSEAEPVHCHRFAMITPALTGFDVRHILKDKSMISQGELEGRMLEVFDKGSQLDIFHTASQRLHEAYKMLNRKIGFVPSGGKIKLRK
jgi:uncharacterized protein (DUF488 family)